MAGLFGGGQTIVNEDNKIAGFQVNSSTYGLPVPVVFGTTRISGNIIDWFDFTAIPHETREQQSGGKGGGGITTVNISYTYQVGVIIGLCEGVISAVGRVWKDKEQFASLSPLGLTLFTGALKQAPWSYVQSVHPERALPYSGLAYVAGVFDLGGSGSLPTLNFEVKGLLLASGDGIDANPADVCEYILSDALNGINFGSAAIDSTGLARFKDYAYAADLLISVPATDQKKPAELLKAICDAVKVQHFWSADRLKFVPRCDETLTRGTVTYTPVTTPEYDLTADDFLEQSDGALVKFSRVEPTEAYNHVPVEFLNRANEYQKELADGRVDVDINARGLRSSSKKEIHYLHTKARAEYAAQLQVMEYLYGRNKYTFTLGWSHCLLEPGDFVTLTDAAIGLDKQPVIIDSVEEDENGKLSVTAYGRQSGIYNPARYSTQNADRPSTDYNADPGDPVNPVIFELPSVLSGGVLKTYIAAAGGGNWGGCNVWVSDNDESYRRVGSVANPARYGSLRNQLLSGAAVDTVNTLKIDLTDSGAVLSSATAEEADNKRTLCWVDGELIAYQTATLVGSNQYDLTYLVRGCYGTPITSHAAGSRFVRVDDAVLFGYQHDVDDIGKTIYAKLDSYNVYGSGSVGIDSVNAITHVIAGISPPDVTGITINEDTFLLKDGTALSDLLVSFTAPLYQADLQYQIYYEVNGSGTWLFAGNGDPAGYKIKALQNAASVRVKIVTVSADGKSAGAISSSLAITGKSAPPSDVTGFTATVDPTDSTKIKLACNRITDLDFKAVEIRVGNTWGTATPLPLLYGFDSLYTAAASGLITFRARALDWSNNYSQNEAVVQVTAQIEPATPTGFNAVQNGREVLLFWAKNAEADVVGYEIRQGATFDSGALVATGITETNLSVPVSTETTYKYWVKAYNRAGNYSAAGASASITVVDLPPVNVILTHDEIALQSGVHTRTVFGTSYYTCLTFPGLCSDYPTTRCNEVGGASVLKLSGANTDGVYLAARKDLGGIVTVNLKANFVSSALIGPGSSARLQIRTSKDGTSWDDWSNFVPATKTTRYIDWQVVLAQYSASYPVEVGIWTEYVDVDDKDITGTYTVPIGGATISYGYAYHAQPVGVVTAIGAGLYADVTARGLNDFAVVVRNASTNADVGGQIDYRFKGY